MTAFSTPSHGGSTRTTRGIITLLAALAAISSLSTNIILPSFPAIATELGASGSQLGLTLSIFFIVFAAGQLVVGPLSDRYGRRSLVIGGLLTFCVGGVLCAQASDISVLIVGRAIQAAGVCAASVLARAIARDLFEGEALSRVLAMIIVAMAAAPGFSPLLGSVAETFFGWRVTFMLVSAMGLLLAAWYATQLGETLSPQSQAPLAIGPVFATYGKLLMDRRFVSPALVVGCVIGGLYGFFAAAPAILMGALGLSSHELGLLFAGTVFVVFAAGLIGPRLSRRWGTQRTIRLGLGLAFVGGVLVWLASARESLDLLSFTAAICVFLFGMGMVNPLSTALSLAPFGAQAGSASAMLGFVQMMGAALGATLVTKLSYFPPMATLGLLIAASQILAIAAFGLLPVPRPDSQG